MNDYRLTANIEWTSKCNAKCAMCPRHAITAPKLMSAEVYEQVMGRLNPRDLVRAIIAGYGEPTTHPLFVDFADGLRRHPLRFDLVTNGERLDEEKIARTDGAFGMVMVSFSSVDPEVYGRVHANLDQRRVMENLRVAARRYRQTRLSVSLTPMPECLDTLPQTIEWLRGEGILDLRMSPNFYNRAGTQDEQAARETLRAVIRRYGLRPLDIDFVPGIADMVRQMGRNRFRCIPRNTSMLISSSGDYMYCYNDIAHGHVLGNVADMELRAAVALREELGALDGLCERCNMRGSYRGGELMSAAVGYFTRRLAGAVA